MKLGSKTKWVWFVACRFKILVSGFLLIRILFLPLPLHYRNRTQWTEGAFHHLHHGHIIIDGWRPNHRIFCPIHTQPRFYSKRSCLGLKKDRNVYSRWRMLWRSALRITLAEKIWIQKFAIGPCTGNSALPPLLSPTQLHWLQPRGEVSSVTGLKDCLGCNFQAATTFCRQQWGGGRVSGFTTANERRETETSQLSRDCVFSFLLLLQNAENSSVDMWGPWEFFLRFHLSVLLICGRDWYPRFC